MKAHVRLGLKLLGVAVVFLLVTGIAVPYINADRFGQRLQVSLERALGRRVELGKVRFSLFQGPGFSVDSAVIHEDPAIGIEPIIYVQEPGSISVVPSFWSLLGGKFVISSISLRGASINVAKSGPASQWGRWNFASLVSPSLMHTVPAIHIRDGRINFKFGDDKSVFYLTETHLDVSPPSRSGKGWDVYCSAKPARTDRPAQGLGSFVLQGRWFVEPERVDLDMQLDRAGLGELTALMRGQSGTIHGSLSSRLHFGGPINSIGISGRLTLEDLYRWDLLPPQQALGWPLDVRGRLDLVGQQLELQSTSAANTTLPLLVRFRASDYLSQPRWAVALNWNHFPVAPVMQLATNMGAHFPPNLALAGSLDGAIGYSGQGSFQGELAFHDAALTIPNSPPVRFEQAHIVFDHGHVRLLPALVRTAAQDEAKLEGDYELDGGTLDLSISTDSMKVASFREQVTLAAVPWLEQVRSGQWSGELHYHYGTAKAGWSGQLHLTDASLSTPGLADPVELAAADAQIDGARIALHQIDAQAGNLQFTGDYRYDPAAAHPHHIALRADEVDAADLEAELMPTLRRGSLIARALGRAPAPDWLKQRKVDGTLQIGDLTLAGSHLTGLRARVLWDFTRFELDAIQAKLDRAAITGRLVVNLRGARPAYRLTGKLKGLNWESGTLDAEGSLQTSGTGAQLLANLNSEGLFSGSSLDFGTFPVCRTASGGYTLAWSSAGPRLRLTSLSVRTEDETYTGRGSTQDDGRLLVLLTNGTKEMRMSGTWAKLKVEEGKP